MAVPTDQAQPNSAEQVLQNIQAVNEQFVFSRLREQTGAEQLRHQVPLISVITNSVAEGVIVVDSVGGCTFVNLAAEHMLGSSQLST